MSGGASNEYDDIRMQETLDGPTEANWTADNKHVIEINDTQQGNYSGGQITFNLSSLASSKSFTDFKQTMLEIPVTMTLEIPPNTHGIRFPQPVAAGGGVNGEQRQRNFLSYMDANRMAMGLKNSSLSVISGIEVWCNGKNVVPLQQLSSLPLTWRMLKEWSEEDERILGPTIGFTKDTSASVIWDPLLGELNNQVFNNHPRGQLGAQNPDAPVNEGRNARLRRASPLRPQYFQTDTEAKNARQDRCFLSADGTKLTFQQWLQIPMRYINEVFENMPLVRAGLWTMTVHTHIPSQHELNYSVTCDPLGEVTLAPQMVTGYMINQFCPYIISPVCYQDETLHALASLEDGQDQQPTGCSLSSPGPIPANTVGTFKMDARISIGIAGESTSTTLKVGQIQLSGTSEQKLLRQPKKEIIWRDFTRMQPEGMNSMTGSLAKMISVAETVNKVRGKLLVAYAPAGYNGTAMPTLSSLMSPFSTAGNTGAPYVNYTSLQVSCSGQPIWDRPYRYSTDLWQREQYGIGSPNGNAVDGFRTGLINETEFRQSYTQLYINLARHEETQDNLPASVKLDVTLNVPAARVLAMQAFVFQEKRMQIDSITGDVTPLQ